MAESSADLESRIMETFSQTCVGLGVALGSKLGLFTAIGGITTDLWTAADLAKASACKERYVLEWLGLMASAGLIQIDNHTEKYYVTKEMRACLEGTAVTSSMFLTGFFHAFPHISDCFRLNGPNGLPMSDQRLHMHALDCARKDISMTIDTSIIHMFPGFGDRLESGITVADIGCASGRLAIALAERFPNSQVYGLDISEESIELGKQRGRDKNLENLHMLIQDAHNLPADYKDKFDVVIAMFVIHDLPFPDRALEQVYSALKPDDGVLCMMEADFASGQKNHVTDPDALAQYTFSIFDCVPNAMAVDGGTVLGGCPGREVLAEYATKAGFKDISFKPAGCIICRKY